MSHGVIRPVTSHSDNRATFDWSFSAFKKVHIYQHNAQTQDKLIKLSLMTCEKKIPQDLETVQVSMNLWAYLKTEAQQMLAISS
jgi:hypothetical protein